MTTGLILFLLTCAGLIALVFAKPSVTVGGHTVSIYWAAPLIGAAILLLSGLLTPAEVAEGLTSSGEVNPIKILTLFLSMTMLSVFLDEVGFFRLLAEWALARAGSSQIGLFLMLYLTVSVLTVFTSNDIIVLTFTPFLCHFARRAQIDPVPYLVTEFVAANTWSMALMIGNPTNIYLISGTDVSFTGYTAKMILPTAAAGLVSLLVLWLIFRRKLRQPITAGIPNPGHYDVLQMIIGLIHLAACIVLLALSSPLGLPMWLITLGFFCSLLICTLIVSAVRRRPPRVLLAVFKRAPWELIPFVIAMFVHVLALDRYGLTAFLTDFLTVGETPALSVATYGSASFLASNLLNNIPMSVLFRAVVSGIEGTAAYVPALFASVVGSNLGAFFSPIGALAGIMWMSQLREHGVSFSFGRFVRYGAAVAAPALLAALGVLMLGI